MSKFKITKDLYNLSLIELITIQKLLDHPTPIVRFLLYQEINQYFHPKTNKTNNGNTFSDKNQSFNLSTSSFYNSLKSLEANGLVSFIKKKQKGRGEILAVRATEKAKVVLKGIIGHLFNSNIDDVNYIVQTMVKLMKKMSISHIANLLVINLSEHIDTRIMEQTFRFTEEFYILANEGIYDSMVKLGFDTLKRTTMYNNVIREPKDIFDVALIPEYEKDLDFNNLTRVDMLEDLDRVVKPGGFIVIIGRSPIPKVENFYVNELVNKYGETIAKRIFTKEEIEEDFKAAGFTNYEITDYKGVIVGVIAL